MVAILHHRSPHVDVKTPNRKTNKQTITGSQDEGFHRRCNIRRGLAYVALLAILSTCAFPWLPGTLLESSTSGDWTNTIKPPLSIATSYDVQDEAPFITENREFEHVVSGHGLDWERLYAFGSIDSPQTGICGKAGQCPVIPVFADGVAAGPLLCTPQPFSVVGQEQTSEHAADNEKCAQTIHDLDVYKMLASGYALRVALDPATDHTAVIKDRERQSSSSGVVFLDDEHFCVVSFSNSLVYLYHYNATTMRAVLLDKAHNKIPGGTDLVGYDGKGTLAMSNLKTATITLFAVDWTTKKLRFMHGVNVFEDILKRAKQMAHGVRFYHSTNSGSNCNSIIVATATFKKSPDDLMVRFYNWRSKRPVAELRMKDTRHSGMGAQDIFMMDKYNMLVVYTHNQISGGLRRNGKNCRPSEEMPITTRLVHYRLEFDLDDADENDKITVIDDVSKFVELQSIEYLHSRPDSIAYNNGIVVLSDQYRDQINVVGIDPTGMTHVQHLGILTGYHLNHGVALSPNMESVAVTQYGDNSVIINKFPPFLRAAMDKHRLSLNLPIEYLV